MGKPKTVRSKAETIHGKGGVLYKLPKGEGGPIEIRIDFGHVPAPEKYFYADAVSLQFDESLLMAMLSFGRRREPSRGVAERIDIAIPGVALLNFWKSVRSVEDTVDQVLKQLAVEAPTMATPFDVEPAATLFANTISVAVGPGETSLDCYCLAPRDVHFARIQQGEIALQPIVRILMSTVLVKSFFSLLRPHMEQSASKETGRRSDRATAVR